MYDLFVIVRDYSKKSQNIHWVFGFNESDIDDGDEDKSYITDSEVVYAHKGPIGDHEELEWFENEYILTKEKLFWEIFK